MDMAAHPTFFEESERLAALANLAILDSGAEREFDAVTKMLASFLGVRSAAVSFIDQERQWFKARHRIDLNVLPRDIAICDHVVRRRNPLVVLDAREHDSFRGNPLVTGDPHIRFYAGVPIYPPTGHCVGSLCALDDKPRAEFTDFELRHLQEFAKMVSELIEARRARLQSGIAAKVVASTPDAVLATNRSAEIVFWNQASVRLFGHEAAEAIGQNVKLIIPSRFHSDDRESFETASNGGPTRLVGKLIELEARRKDGSIFPIELSLAPWGDEVHGGFAAVIRDITDRKQLQAERDSGKKFLNAIVTNLPSMLFVKDAETHRYLLVNKKVEDIIGQPAADVLGKDDSELFSSRGTAFKQNDLVAIASGNPECVESVFERNDGVKFNIKTTRVLIDGPDRSNQYLLGLSEDITEIRQSEAERWKLARYDTLTGLLNRASFLERVGTLIEDEAPFAILNIDLDRFKSVNDHFGHVVGDEVLRSLGERLGVSVDDGTLIARLGGDEFICLLTGEDLRSRARTVAFDMLQIICAPVQVGGVTANVGASIGVAVYPDDGESIEVLRQNADLAMYRAKLEGGREPCFFDARMDAAERDRRVLETELRAAVEAELFDVVYQPIVRASSGAVTGFEALARWTEPARGPVPPDLFISLAENCGLVDALGEQILRRACRDAAQWPNDLQVAVNLSPRQFYSGQLVGKVLQVLRETGLPSRRLQLEVTENLVIQNSTDAFAQLEELRRHGIETSLDDFGIGYSSLSYFQKFRFDKVKIDKSFVLEIEKSQAAKAIVRAVVGLADQLSMAVVAEGVETAQQRKLLEGLGCSHLQGFLFSKPLAHEHLLSIFDRGEAFGELPQWQWDVSSPFGNLS